jgi:hypothetical protein
MRSGRIPLDIDLYIPIFTILQFFFYMGLLKVTLTPALYESPSH